MMENDSNKDKGKFDITTATENHYYHSNVLRIHNYDQIQWTTAKSEHVSSVTANDKGDQ